PTAGLLNVALGGHALNWLGDPHLALPAAVLADVWRTAPLVAARFPARPRELMLVLTGGGPAGTTETITVYAYRALFQTLQLGFGSALSVVVFVVVMTVAWAYLRLLRTSTGTPWGAEAPRSTP